MGDQSRPRALHRRSDRQRRYRMTHWYLAAAQRLTRWAAVGIRYDRYDPDADARQQVGSSIVPRDKTFTTLSLVGAVMWRSTRASRSSGTTAPTRSASVTQRAGDARRRRLHHSRAGRVLMRARLALFVVAANMLAGCGAQSGRSRADLQITGGHFRVSALPSPNPGRQVAAVLVGAGVGRPGRSALLGVLDASATAVLLALDGDVGYWVVDAGVPQVDAPTLPTFSVIAAFGQLIPSGTRSLIAEAVDVAGATSDRRQRRQLHRRRRGGADGGPGRAPRLVGQRRSRSARRRSRGAASRDLLPPSDRLSATATAGAARSDRRRERPAPRR